MFDIALTVPGLYVTIVVIVVLAALVYWKRNPITKWLRNLRVKEIKLGPVKLSPGEEEDGNGKPSSGILLKGTFERARLKDMTGGNRVEGSATTVQRSCPGSSRLELKGDFKDSDIEGLTGGNRVTGSKD